MIFSYDHHNYLCTKSFSNKGVHGSIVCVGMYSVCRITKVMKICVTGNYIFVRTVIKTIIK